MLYESSEDSSNQLDGPMGPWIGIKDQVTDLYRPICPCWYLILDNIIWKYILYLVTLFLDKDLFAYGTPPEKNFFLGRSFLKGQSMRGALILNLFSCLFGEIHFTMDEQIWLEKLLYSLAPIYWHPNTEHWTSPTPSFTSSIHQCHPTPQPLLTYQNCPP